MEWYFIQILLRKLHTAKQQSYSIALYSNWIAWITRKLYNSFRLLDALCFTRTLRQFDWTRTANAVWGEDANNNFFFAVVVVLPFSVLLFPFGGVSLSTFFFSSTLLHFFLSLLCRMEHAKESFCSARNSSEFPDKNKEEHVRRVEECQKNSLFSFVCRRTQIRMLETISFSHLTFQSAHRNKKEKRNNTKSSATRIFLFCFPFFSQSPEWKKIRHVLCSLANNCLLFGCCCCCCCNSK